ncbi:hypothetical protein DQ04_09591000 [Trypanosoma grayi]|uniref:hypothetical protein n=1 Tax=Trypanosoma grayi TaxID=71804 RepID=UPI0004F4B8D6|nr:hypothetical protein DQ04_09591000 [Trypanosoma grayi]KEG07506.1 hypothetical protein DQ04_09591000 [Trypanosoma grayi]
MQRHVARRQCIAQLGMVQRALQQPQATLNAEVRPRRRVLHVPVSIEWQPHHKDATRRLCDTSARCCHVHRVHLVWEHLKKTAVCMMPQKRARCICLRRNVKRLVKDNSIIVIVAVGSLGFCHHPVNRRRRQQRRREGKRHRPCAPAQLHDIINTIIVLGLWGFAWQHAAVRAQSENRDRRECVGPHTQKRHHQQRVRTLALNCEVGDFQLDLGDVVARRDVEWDTVNALAHCARHEHNDVAVTVVALLHILRRQHIHGVVAALLRRVENDGSLSGEHAALLLRRQYLKRRRLQQNLQECVVQGLIPQQRSIVLVSTAEAHLQR